MLNIYRNTGKFLLFKRITRDTEGRKFCGTPVLKCANGLFFHQIAA